MKKELNVQCYQRKGVFSNSNALLASHGWSNILAFSLLNCTQWPEHLHFKLLVSLRVWKNLQQSWISEIDQNKQFNKVRIDKSVKRVETQSEYFHQIFLTAMTRFLFIDSYRRWWRRRRRQRRCRIIAVVVSKHHHNVKPQKPLTL